MKGRYTLISLFLVFLLLGVDSGKRGGSTSLSNFSTTGAISVYDGAELGEGSSNCVDAGGVLTCDDFATRNANSAGTQRAVLAVHGCSAATTKTAAPLLSTSCQNFESGGIAAVRAVGIPLNQLRPVTLKAFTLDLWGFGTGAGWEADEAFEVTLSRCSLDTSPAYADCTDVDTFVIQNRASPNITYGAGSRTAASCNTSGGTCSKTWNIDGGGKASSAGDPTLDAGTAQYLVVWWESDATNYTSDAGTDSGTINASIAVDFEN